MTKKVVVLELKDNEDFEIVDLVMTLKKAFTQDEQSRVIVHAAINESAEDILAVFTRDETSPLVDHAKRELTLIETDQWYINGLVRIVREFAAMGHSGGSASIAIPQLNALLQFKNLSSLTNDPSEWNHVSEGVWGSPGGVWQSQRNSEAFSNDGGKTYYLLSEIDGDAEKKLHVSKEK